MLLVRGTISGTISLSLDAGCGKRRDSGCEMCQLVISRPGDTCHVRSHSPRPEVMNEGPHLSTEESLCCLSGAGLVSKTYLTLHFHEHPSPEVVFWATHSFRGVSLGAHLVGGGGGGGLDL